MADTTSHDTVGASTLAVPYFPPSSPPPPEEHPEAASPRSATSPVNSPGAPRSPSHSPPPPRDSSLDRAARELDARLAEYSVDFSQFPSAHGPEDALSDLPDEDEEADRLSAVGGPEDFTANLERYLLGDDDDGDASMDHNDLDSEFDEDEKPNSPLQTIEPQQPQSHDHRSDQESESRIQQQAAEDDAELGEDSEFGAPLDMSTPSHFLRRTAGLARDITHLEDIEEGPNDDDDDEDGPSAATTPSVRKLKSPLVKDQEKQNGEDLRQRIAELTQAVQDRDEQLEKNRKRVLEAASAGEQIKHLQGELLRKSNLIEELQSLRGDESLLREQIHLLQRQNGSSTNASEFAAIQQQIAALQKDMQARQPQPEIDSERLETIAMLRQQLSLTQEQLKKRDATLDETLAKLKDVTAAKELQLQEKNAEIDSLRAQIDTQQLDIEKLERDVACANREYQALEDQMVLLETKNRPLEEKNSTLEADLTRAQSQVTAQENALKAMAADLPLETAGNTYTEILELIKDLGQPGTARPTAIPRDPEQQELEQIREELFRLRAEFTETSSTKKALELQLSRSQEQATEAQLLIQSIETENSRLTKRADDLKSALEQTANDLSRLRTQYADALQTIGRLQDEQSNHKPGSNQQQPSPPATPLTTRKSPSTTALEMQITNLKAAHATAISTLRASHTDSTRKLRSLLAASEKREATLQAQLDSFHSQQRQMQNSESLRAEIKRLQSVIAAKEETTAAIDARIARSVEKREKEWERRVELLLKEREKMGRALMWSWGEKELGEDKENLDENGKRRQAYRYKHGKK